jgi:ubiquinone/menaquinone biosynthesis C-methylase UbiE
MSARFGEYLASTPSESYERYFVPAIGRPVADDLLALAALQPGERVLDVACGTGIVARMAAADVGEHGSVAGVDVHPGMLAVARTVTPSDTPITWHQASAESMPLPDESFDVVTCQLGLQFVPDPERALREMRRVLVDRGRIALNVPAPMSPRFAVLTEAMAHHIGDEAAGFVAQVFALDDPAMLERLFHRAGFRDVAVAERSVTIDVPAPEEFLWQYVASTPLAGAVASASDESRTALEREVVARWEHLHDDGADSEQGLLVGHARR